MHNYKVLMGCTLLCFLIFMGYSFSFTGECLAKERVATERWYIEDPTVAKSDTRWTVGIAPELWFTWWSGLTHEYDTFEEEYSDLNALMVGLNFSFSKGVNTLFFGLRLGSYSADLERTYTTGESYNMDFSGTRFEMDFRYRRLYPDTGNFERAVPYLIGGIYYVDDTQESEYDDPDYSGSDLLYTDEFSAIILSIGAGLLYPMSDRSGLRFDLAIGPATVNRDHYINNEYEFSESDLGYAVQSHATFYFLFTERFNVQTGLKGQYIGTAWGDLPILGGFIMLGYTFN